MSAIASQITGVSIVYSTVCSGADQTKHQSSASLAFVRGIHRWPVNSPFKGPVTRKKFSFEDVIMCCGDLWLLPRIHPTPRSLSCQQTTLQPLTDTDTLNGNSTPPNTNIDTSGTHWTVACDWSRFPGGGHQDNTTIKGISGHLLFLEHRGAQFSENIHTQSNIHALQSLSHFWKPSFNVYRHPLTILDLKVPAIQMGNKKPRNRASSVNSLRPG